MTLQRRPRRHPSVPDQQDRLRALGLDSSPTARRLRARIPRPPVEPVTGPSSGDPPIPSAPYSVPATRTPYSPAAPGGGGSPGPWAERDPDDTLPAPPEPDASPPDGPWRDPGASAEEAGRHRRPERPPSGYSEFRPDPAGPLLLERLARSWGANATLSRRAVLTLLVLGVLAVAAAVLLMRERPDSVSAPDVVTQAAPAEHTGDEEETDEEGEEGAAPDGDVVVHVGGEVSEPGLYTMPPGSRVADAVEEAGGALPDADLDLLNLARHLVDGEQVLVGVPAPGAPGAGPQDGGPLVDINRADPATLRTLPGVGEVIAQNIVAHREEHGPFTGVDGLIDVDRIGEKVLADIEPLVTVG